MYIVHCCAMMAKHDLNSRIIQPMGQLIADTRYRSGDRFREGQLWPVMFFTLPPKKEIEVGNVLTILGETRSNLKLPNCGGATEGV